ncbi:MAG: hypothetical protein HYU99_08930 [Deltaproteobacteria bacterium]|nr:hypothetical protein [Deltaproteobacteria bacterium]
MKKRGFLWYPAVGFILMASACSSSSSSSDSSDEATSGLQFDVAGDFDSSASAASALIRRVTTGECADLEDSTMDSPILEDGLDCDGDDGIVEHITPSRYALAFKRATLLPADVEGEDAESVDLIADTGTLAASEIVDFTEDDTEESIISIDSADLPAGTYSGVEVELYYFQLTFQVAGVEQNVRVYMSDDDFEAEGSLGHHQGDITFIDDNDTSDDLSDDTELGWIDSTWLSENLSDTRGDGQNGAGGVDDETGHDRGFFGNEEQWEQEELNQGAEQDIYLATLDFDELLTIDPEVLTTITAAFSVADTFYYEDFAPQDTADFPGFFPGDGGEATAESGEWAPLIPTAEITADTSS